MRRSSFAPTRRRRSPLPIIIVLLFVLLIGGAVWLSTIDTEAPQTRIEQDVTNELAR
jgi:hypothetical protein